MNVVECLRGWSSEALMQAATNTRGQIKFICPSVFPAPPSISVIAADVHDSHTCVRWYTCDLSGGCCRCISRHREVAPGTSNKVEVKSAGIKIKFYTYTTTLHNLWHNASLRSVQRSVCLFAIYLFTCSIDWIILLVKRRVIIKCICVCTPVCVCATY